MLEETHKLVRSKAASREQDREFSTDIEAIAGIIEHGEFQALVPKLLADLGCA
jgi:histidine ammonia-lyase